MWLFIVYLACVGWCTDVPASRVKVSASEFDLSGPACFDRCAGVPGGQMRATKAYPDEEWSAHARPRGAVNPRARLSFSRVRCLPSARPRRHIGLPTASASAALVKLTKGKVLYTKLTPPITRPLIRL